MKIILLIVISLITTIVSCESQKKNIINDRKIGKIILVFENTPIDSKNIILPNGQTIENNTNPLSILTSEYEEPLLFNKKDTIIINTNSNFLILKYRYNPISVNEYVFQNGDIAEIKFSPNEGSISINIKNRNCRLFDNNYDSLLRKNNNIGLLSPIELYNEPFLGYDIRKLPHKDLMKELKEIDSKIKADNYILALKNFKKETSLLDSLFKEDLISNETFNYFSDRLLFQKLSFSISNSELKFEDFKKIIANYQSKGNNISYRFFLSKGIDFFISKEAKKHFSGDGLNKDYREVYDRIVKNTFTKNDDKKYLLTREIDRIAKSFSNKDFLEYFARFEKDVVDTIYVGHIRNKYSLKFNDKKNETNSLVLMTSHKKQITFDDLKKRHAGKLIYVDFWASWCAPCRKALPFSIKIKDKNKDVVFVYLSMDSTIDPWQKAIVDEKLHNYSESYLIVNSETSNFLKKQNVSAIPRYMIFDRKGVLAFANAPSAESKELGATFAKLLSK
ncbi:thiol-disulfide isomerase/thioredoxin [Arcicella aurantiaca]|uniref:Thiol-disulfide isomerase/thioredoxin n=1 Tax=Arcicella aurantiaca TaxID=591202 RepID=A0A316DGA2_9BACT|nr:TlpA disulfide reductase family protein [Arcicella aurantiaca]PWK16676.1 thiol-disulfide isomerase/thioredoxin [Arcicella aurantiaca]